MAECIFKIINAASRLLNGHSQCPAYMFALGVRRPIEVYLCVLMTDLERAIHLSLVVSIYIYMDIFALYILFGEHNHHDKGRPLYSRRDAAGKTWRRNSTKYLANYI